jgi:DNA modification methylase
VQHPTIRTVQLSDISLDPANLRRHPVRNLEAIKASLRRFGQQKPIVVDAKGVIIAGNGVYTAARELGWKQIACVDSSLAGVERVAYAIADNQTPLLAEWDEPALLDTLEAMEPGEAETLGFSREDITAMRDEDLAHIEDDPAIAPAPVPVTQLGDIWHLGDHRIINGDSTKPETYAALMQGEKAALCNTDPPYIVEYTGERIGGSGKDWSTLYREVDIPNAKDFYAAIWPCILSHCESNAALYCWHAHSRARDLQNAWDTNGVLTHQFIVWVKPNSVPGRSCWFWRHEPALMGWLQGNRPRVNAYYECTAWEVDAGDLSMLNTDDLRRLVQEHSDVWQTGWENGAARPSNNEHPTQKPLEIFARPMRKHTLIGDVVLEPFSGSGSQLIAAEKLRRRCRAIELQPVFVDVAVRRWQRETGRDARLADGRTWREVAKARGVRLGPDDTPLDVQAPRVVEPKPKRGKHQPCPPDSPSSAAVADAAASPMATPPTAKSTRGKRGKAAGATPTPAPPIVDTGATGEPSAAAS